MSEKKLTNFARDLRKHDTRAEHQLWQVLRDRRLGGWKWKRQIPLGPFIVDFHCHELDLVIELDGATHSTDEELAYDRRREARLRSQGLRVLRFYNHAIFENRSGVCEAILAACGGEKITDGPSPRPSPAGRERE